MFDSIRSLVQFRKFEFTSAKRKLNKAANIEDLRKICKRRLPRGVFDYIDGAAEDERTLRKNSSIYAKVAFKPRVLRDVADIDVSTSVLGSQVSFPLIISPTGFTRLAHPVVDLAIAQAANITNITFI